MARSRSGNYNAFWANVATGAAGNSNPVELSQGVAHLAINIAVSGATVVKVQVSPMGDVSAEGVKPDADINVWHDLNYAGTAASVTFAGAGATVLVIPDWVPAHVRLQSSNNITATAGWEAVSAD